jgi:hypothetical protein
MSVHAYTSFSYSYLNRARVWASSLRRLHPDWILWAVITDREPEGFKLDLTVEPFDRVLTVEELFGEETESWLFGLDIVEACTGVKGRALKYILEREDSDAVLYFDPDTAVFNSMDPVIEYLRRFSIVLTPHQVEPEPPEDLQAIVDNEIGSLKWGVFNLGFLAVNKSDEAKLFANWWEARLYSWCHDRVDKGIFVDQKWCNLVPCLFDGVLILRDPGYNVASWNLNRRRISIDASGNILVNGNLLRFFHFTKLGPTGDAMTARYAKDNIIIYELWSAYKRWIENNTDSRIPDGYWYYNTFNDGTKIEEQMRINYRDNVVLRREYTKPFTGLRPDFHSS